MRSMYPLYVCLSIYTRIQYQSDGARMGCQRGENGSARSIASSNGCVHRVGNIKNQCRCCVVSGLRVLKQA